MISNETYKLIVFCHFPKAGGTSIAAQLKNHFGSAYFADWDHDPLISDGADAVSELVPGIACVSGHFPASRYDQVKGRFLFTFLREPIDNLLSIFFFWKVFPRSQNPWHQKFLDEAPTVVEFARFPPIRNLMSRSYFGGFDMDRFDFIGFHDSRVADLSALSRLTGLKLDPTVHENRTADRQPRSDVLDDAMLRSLRDILSEDIAWYETIRMKRQRQYGGGFAL